MATTPHELCAPAPLDLKRPFANPFEHGGVLVCEVAVLWRGDLLSISHLLLPGTFHVGPPSLCCDVALPVERLGAERQCIVVAGHSDINVVVPSRAASVWVLPDGSEVAASDMAPGESERPFADERLIPLEPGSRARLYFDEIEIQVAAVPAGRRLERPWKERFDPLLLTCFAFTWLLVGGLLGALWLMAPPRGLTRDEQGAMRRVMLLRHYLNASAERASRQRGETEPKAIPPPRLLAARAQRAGRSASTVAEVEGEIMAETEPTAPPLDATGTDAVARREQVREARGFGAIALLGEAIAALADPRLNFERAGGAPHFTRMHEIFDSDLDDASGTGGLSLTGIGIGAGGPAEIVALEAVRTIGSSEDPLNDFPRRSVQLTNDSRSELATQNDRVGPALSRDEVRRTIERHLPRLSRCYPARQPGTISPKGTSAASWHAVVDLIIQGDGRVERARTSEASRSSQSASECVTSVFLAMRFPAGRSQSTSVRYPLELRP